MDPVVSVNEHLKMVSLNVTGFDWGKKGRLVVAVVVVVVVVVLVVKATGSTVVETETKVGRRVVREF